MAKPIILTLGERPQSTVEKLRNGKYRVYTSVTEKDEVITHTKDQLLSDSAEDNDKENVATNGSENAGSTNANTEANGSENTEVSSSETASAGDSQEQTITHVFLCETVEVESLDYATIVRAIVRSHYSADEVEAILSNGTDTKEHADEMTAFQSWRKEAKALAHNIVEGE